jgi:hypothetical protein
MTCTMCKHEWCWICSEPNHGTKCTKPVQKDKRERFVAASKNSLALESVTKSSLESLVDAPSRASVMALEGVVDNCITARSHIITIFADAQVPISSFSYYHNIYELLLQVAFGKMSEKELREHMDDMWDALYVRLRASCPEGAAQVRSHASHRRRCRLHRARSCSRMILAQAASDMLRCLPLKELQVCIT